MKKLLHLKETAAQGTANIAQEEDVFKKNARKHAMSATADFLHMYCDHFGYEGDAEFAAHAAAWRESRAKEIAAVTKCSPADVLVCVLHNFSPQVRKSHWDIGTVRCKNLGILPEKSHFQDVSLKT